MSADWSVYFAVYVHYWSVVIYRRKEELGILIIGINMFLGLLANIKMNLSEYRQFCYALVAYSLCDVMAI